MPGVDARTRGWLIDLVVGAMAGGVIGAIAAVNLVIYAGPEEGYEASPGRVFEHSLVLGLVVVAVLAGGPILGVVLARRLRGQRARAG